VDKDNSTRDMDDAFAVPVPSSNTKYLQLVILDQRFFASRLRTNIAQ